MSNVCKNCGRPGNHLVPPDDGNEGYFSCETLARTIRKHRRWLEDADAHVLPTEENPLD